MAKCGRKETASGLCTGRSRNCCGSKIARVNSEGCVTSPVELSKRLKQRMVTREESTSLLQCRNRSVVIESNDGIRKPLESHRAIESVAESDVRRGKLSERKVMKNAVIFPALSMQRTPIRKIKKPKMNYSNSRELIHSFSELKERKSLEISSRHNQDKQPKLESFREHRAICNLKISRNSILKNHSKNSSHMHYLRNMSILKTEATSQNLIDPNNLQIINENTKDTMPVRLSY